MAYMSQEKKAQIAAKLKAVVPAGWKYSLSVRNHSTLVLTIASAPVDLLATINRHAQEDVRHPMTYASVYFRAVDRHFEGDTLQIMERIAEALDDGNHDRSDLQSDYFDVGWYVDINIGRWDRPFVCTASQPAPEPLAA